MRGRPFAKELTVKIVTRTPPRDVPMKSLTDFTNASRDAGLFLPTVMAIETSAQHQALIKLLNDSVRPYAVCVLRVK